MQVHPKTVVVEHPSFPDGLMINVDDFDENVHKPWTPPSKTLKLPEAKASATSADAA